MKKLSLIMVFALSFNGVVLADEVCENETLGLNVKPSRNIADFEIPNDNDKIVIDTRNNLMWLRCELGQSLHPIDLDCYGGGNAMDWSSALQAALTFNADTANNHGFSDWRLPNVKELMSIVENKCYQPAVNIHLFEGALSNFVWTNTPESQTSTSVYLVNFTDGVASKKQNTSSNYVRLVRDYTP